MYRERLQQLKQDAIDHNICGEYLDKWNNARSKRQLFDIALRCQGGEFMVNSMADNWGVSSEFLKNNFGNFINKQYILQEPYTSCMYVEYDDNIHIDTTVTILVNCHCKLFLPNNDVYYHLYLCGGSDITLCGNGKVKIYKKDKDKFTNNGNIYIKLE